jgi:hypothetical protein
MLDKSTMQGQRIKIVLRRFHVQTPREIIRGMITEIDEFGFRVSGRRFQEVTDLESSLPVERPVEGDNKVYWVPYNSVRYSEIILPGSSSEHLDNEIQRRKPLTLAEMHGKSRAD